MNSYPFSVCCVHELKNSKIQLLNRAKSSRCFFTWKTDIELGAKITPLHMY